MTTSLLGYALGNTLLSAPIAVLASIIGRSRRYPALAHFLWVLVLLRLVMPSITSVPLLSLEVPVPMLAVPAPATMTAEHGKHVSFHENEYVTGQSSANSRKPEPEQDTVTRQPDFSLLADQAPTGLNPVPILGLIWFFGTAFIVLISIARIARFESSIRVSCWPAPVYLETLARQAATDLLMKFRAKVLVTRASIVPFVWGLGAWPTIVLPESIIAGSTETELRLILVHELSHIRRRDHLVRWLDWGVLAWLWWNPLAWVARRGLKATEELACDALVLRTRGTNPREYGSCLIAMAETLAGLAYRTPTQACSMGASGLLEQRIRSIMSGSHLARPSLSLRLSTIAAAAPSIVAAVAWVPIAVSARTSLAAQAEPPVDLLTNTSEVRSLRASLKDPHEVDIEITNGSITVVRDEALTSMEVTVVVGGGGTGGWWGKTTKDHRAAVRSAELVAKRDHDGKVNVRVDIPRTAMFFHPNPPRTEVTIRTPALGMVRAKTTNGAIRTAGDLGKLALETINGSLDISGAMSSVRADTTNGKIHIVVPAESQSEIEASSTNGSISLELPASWEGAVSARTSVGPIKVQGVDGNSKRGLTGATFRGNPAPGSPAKASLDVTNGSIQVRRS